METCLPESRVEQIGMNCRIRINENALGGEPLRTVTSYRVSMIEVAMGRGIELNFTTIVEARGNTSIGCDRIDCSKVAVLRSRKLARR